MPSIGGNFLEVRDCVFIKGFPSDSGIDVSDVRECFENKVGKCCVQMTALSKDKRWSFITLKFDSNALAEDAIDRFNGKYLLGHKVQISFWRVPKSLAQSGRFQRNNHNLNSRRWDDKRSFEEEAEKTPRHVNDFSRETITKSTESRESVGYDGKEEFRVDQDNRRYPGGTFAERKKNFNYEEHCNEYSQQYWNGDEGDEEAYPIFDENWAEWDSDFSGRNENLSEREFYNREEDLSHAHEEDIWPEREQDHEREQEFGQYDNYPEIYQDNLREECQDSHYAYSERPLEDTWEEPPYRGEDLMPRNRQWYDDSECTDTQDCRNQEGNQNSFPSFGEGKQWPRWETVAPSNPIRRKPSDPDVITDTPKDSLWVQNPRSCNKLREFTGRRAAAVSDERPRSDEWISNTHRHFRDRGRHSASPVDVHPMAYGHRGSSLWHKTLKASTEITSNSAHSRRGRSSISPARNRHSSVNRESSRSLSAERGSDFRHQGTSPGSERSSQTFNEQRLDRRKRESRSYSPNPNTKVPLLRERSNENGNGNGGRRVTDLRRSLMLHQQRKHSSLRERSREKSIKYSERTTKTSLDKRDKSPGSYSSAESSSSTQGTNRKRRKYDDEKRRNDVETTKRRRKTSLNHFDNASTYSDPENGNRDSNRKNKLKTTSGSRIKNQPPQEKKRKAGQQRGHVTDYSIKKRADRLLNEVAVTLTECKISLRRPGSKEDPSKEGTSSSITSVERKGVDSVRDYTTKPTGQSEKYHPSEKSHLEHAKSVATENPQLLDAFEVDQCTNETPAEDWAVGGISEGNITTPDNNPGHLPVPCFEGSSDLDMSEVEEDYSGTDLSKENLDYTEKNARTEDVSTENDDVMDVKKNSTFTVDDPEATNTVEVPETDFQRTSEADFIVKMEDKENFMQGNYHKDKLKTTNKPTEKPVHPAEKPVRNSYDFALRQSPVNENKIYTKNDTSNETLSTNLQHVHKKISSAEETTTKLDLVEETWLPGDVCVYGEGENQFGASNSLIIEVGKEMDGSVCQKDVQTSIQQTSYACQELGDKVSEPGALLSHKVFCHPMELNNTENAMVERDEEDHIMEKVSSDITKAERNTCALGNDCHSVNPTRREGLPPKINVCSTTLNAEVLNQEGYNTEDSNCDNKGIRAACVMEKVQDDAIYTGREQYVSVNEYRSLPHEGNNFDKGACKTECCEVISQYIDGDNKDMTDVISVVQEAHELEDAVIFFKCQEVTYANEEVFILEDAKVTQREFYDIRDIAHVCNSRNQECQGNDVDFDVTNIDEVCITGVNTQQNVSNKVSAGEDIPDRQGTNMENVVVDTSGLDQEHCVVGSIDVMSREENRSKVWNMKDKKRNSENAGFNGFNTEMVCDMESNDITNAKKEKLTLNNVDFINEERKYDDIEQKVYNMVDGCVTQQDVYCSKDGNCSHITGTENHIEVSGGVYQTDTDQESYDVDTNSYNTADAQVKQETPSIANNTSEDARLKFSSQQIQLSEIASKGKPADIGTHEPCWTSLEPSNSSVAQAQYSTTDVDVTKSSASFISISNVNPQEKEHHSVTEDFEQVDMEISSEEEPRDHFIGSSISVNTSTSSIENDGCKLYSPSSPTWTSDEHRSPLPKNNTSPYSPSHPTNVSEADVEVCFTNEDLSRQGGERETDAPICEVKEDVYPDVCKNTSRSRAADEEEEVLHSNQIIKGKSMSDTTPRSSRYFRSPTSGAVLRQRVSAAKDFIDGNLPTKDLMKNRIVPTSDENGKSVAKDSEVCSDNSTTDEGNKHNGKPLLRSEKRTKSLPAIISMDAKPKVVYVTAAKTYDFFTNRGTQHKPRILYATNDKSAGPVRSLSLDTALGKGWHLCESSNNRPVDCDQQPQFVVEKISTAEVEIRKDGRDTDGHMKPMFPDGSVISDVPLKRETPGTSDVTDKRPFACTGENKDFGFSDQETSMPKISVQPCSIVLEVEGENEKDAQSECLREIQQQVFPLGNEKTLSKSTSCSTNKRTHPDSTSEVSRPCKVPRKPLKLVIPTTPLSNHDIKRTLQPAHRGRYFKKTSSATVTRARVNVVPESNSSKVLLSDVSSISEFSEDKDIEMTEEDTCSENVELACILSPAVSGTPATTDCPPPTCKTGNTSPFTTHDPPCKTSNENNNIMEKKASSCSGNESECMALRMERLRKKKEEIEQVYKRECHTVVNVVKMLVSNDPRLEGLLQNAVRRSLQDMGRRCVQELEKQVRPGS